VVNTSFMMGGALGLAILVAVSSWWTGGQPDPTSLESLHGGFQVAFAIGAVFAAAAAVIGGAYLRPKPMVVPDAEAVDEVAVPVH
jgi:Mg/Co/Ni transporter MgtE